MERNVLYTKAPKFILALAVLFLMTGCETSTSPWDKTLETGTPSVQTPSTPSPQAALPKTPVPAGKTKVALLVPMSGRGSDAGQAMLNAAQLAMFDLGADAFELIPGDTGMSATAAAHEAVTNGASMILGPLFAEDARVVSPIAQQAGLNVLSFSTDRTVANSNTFILGFLPQSQVNRVLEYAGSKALNRVALIAPNDAYGNAVASTFDLALSQRGLINGGVLRYSGTQPTSEQLQQFVSANSFNAVLIAANISQSSVIAQGIPPTIQKLGTGLWDQIDGTAYPSLSGAWYAAASPASRKKFELRYRDTYGSMPPRLASLAYDAAALAVVLSKQGQGFGRNALANPNGFSAIDGIFRLLPDGLNERGLAVLQIGSGQARIIQEAPKTFR
ncbi:MAG: penicillin-binding protein activator [Micavibrio aeruginosavorus]|uniref:Penicillin-binding protein activator n=1 Tax=Micavibrio aeruginosavorus TaxID=349221 RepID=A0A2W5FH73_9BACT|nr:MAG: penicillin-binding protein activator [Micavibrio aeruginosavorus]